MKYYLLLFLCITPVPLYCMMEETEAQVEEVVGNNPGLFERFCEKTEHFARFDFCQEKMEGVVDFVQDGWEKGALYEKLEEKGYYPFTYSLAVISVCLVVGLKCPVYLIPPAVIAGLGARKFIEVWNERKLNKE